jgi:hypothetical protein
MNNVKFADLIRYYTKTNATTFTDADILVLANIFKDDICSKIEKSIGEDYFGLRFDTHLVGGAIPLGGTVPDPGTREYQLPSELMGRIKYVQAKLDGTNWEHLKETDLSVYGKGLSETDIQSIYADKDPEFDIWDGCIYILSGTQINQVDYGLKIWAIIYPADIANLTDTTDLSINPDEYSHGIPRQFHELLARRVSIAYKSSKDRPIPLSDKEQMYELDLQKTIDSMKDMNLDRITVPSVPEYDGSEY